MADGIDGISGLFIQEKLGVGKIGRRKRANIPVVRGKVGDVSVAQVR